MDISLKIVTKIPLEELWDATKLLDAQRKGNLGMDEIRQLLRDEANLVVADLGHPLRWISAKDRFVFWKTEVKIRLVPRDAKRFEKTAVKRHSVPHDAKRFSLESYPGQYCYIASLWKVADRDQPIILLEKYH